MQGASGVGLAATQLAKVLFKDTKVIVTAGKYVYTCTILPRSYQCSGTWKILSMYHASSLIRVMDN